MHMMDIDDMTYELVHDMNTMEIKEKSTNDIQENMLSYVISLEIHHSIKNNLIFLIENDNIESYVDIYNICMENEIELPPI